MSNEQDNTAVVAIIIALIAFFVTTAQLLQALFGTAEGYRRCQASVIGAWATKTRRVWRWSEFRFETIFTTPNIHLYSVMDEQRPVHLGAFIEGSPTSRRETYTDQVSLGGTERLREFNGYSEANDDLVSWLSFLSMLHHFQFFYFSDTIYGRNPQFNLNDSWALAGKMTCPAITFRTRSWDFMPPDIVRPFATSNVGDILALAHRLGLHWKEVRPDDGVMRAEGNGQSITSTTVRGIGLLLQYTFDRSITEEKIRTLDIVRTLTVPSREADMLGFQIVSGSRDLYLPDFIFDKSNNAPAVKLTMAKLGINRDAQDMYVDYVQRSGSLHGFSDLIGMVTPFLPLPGSSVVRIFSPYPDVHDSPTNWWEGFVVYHARLLEYTEEKRKTGDLSEQMKWVLERFEYMRRTYPWNQCPSWEAESANNDIKNGRSIRFLNDLRNIWSMTMTYFRKLQRKQSFRYIDLVGAHIAQAVYYPDLAKVNIKAGTNKRYELGAGRSKRVAEGMHIYVDQIPKIIEFMKEKGFDDESIISEAWWTLILKAMCWHRSVAFIEIERGFSVPPSFHGSRIPVYIA
ncbi:hypothetical protein IMSHALPRED_005846 [Imshaugia aleurites]|uniref:Uncharacterized protein n=1 Tax=Imshaugia aleurites TaxID=172621 RepID=A0A8H3IR93_9LECA|nr:hypothetical protein IMSHALPRED_005846 [Imshaugia aleurites]